MNAAGDNIGITATPPENLTSVDYYHFLQNQAAERRVEGGEEEEREGGGMCVARAGQTRRRVCIKLSPEHPAFTQSSGNCQGGWVQRPVWRRDGGVYLLRTLEDGGGSVWVAEWPLPLTTEPINAAVGEALRLTFLA